MKRILLAFAILLVALQMNAQEKSVTVSGHVMDYSGNAIAGASVCIQNEKFDDVYKTKSDSKGFFSLSVKRGKYFCMSAINMSTYPKSKELSVSEKDMRLEFWAWNVIADRDTTLDIRYNRMEAYGINVFSVQGATPAYQIYVRPMGLTRAMKWMKTQDNYAALAPSPDNLDVNVSIDGEPVNVLMKQEVKEYFSPTQFGNAYLITVSLPKSELQKPYSVFKIELADKENGDKGEGLYYMENPKGK